VNDTGYALSLTSGGALTASGKLEAASLTGAANGAVTLTGANQIGTLGAFTDGTSGATFSFTDGQALSVTGPVTVASGSVSLTTTTGNINVAGPITTKTLTLVSAGQALETTSGAVKVTTINVTAKTGINLDSTSNLIGAIGTDKTNSGTNVIDKN